MKALEREKRMRLCVTTEDWDKLYFDVFGTQPQWGGDNWGAYRMEALMDAIFYNRPIKERPVAESLTL